jgi:hypothetical protein
MIASYFIVYCVYALVVVIPVLAAVCGLCYASVHMCAQSIHTARSSKGAAKACHWLMATAYWPSVLLSMLAMLVVAILVMAGCHLDITAIAIGASLLMCWWMLLPPIVIAVSVQR